MYQFAFSGIIEKSYNERLFTSYNSNLLRGAGGEVICESDAGDM